MTQVVLPEGVVHLALMRLDEQFPAQVDGYLGLLHPSERARHDRLLLPEPRRQYLATRALVRTELTRYAPVAPEDWRFRPNAHGRPELDGHSEAEWLRFNLSNTRGLIACAVARDVDVGVDVEETSGRRSTVELADRFFSPGEVEDLHALPVEAQRDRFFDYWTLKEAYIKARGLGLAIPLDRFTFRLEPGRPIRLETDPSLGDDGAAWQFWLERPLPDHRMAVAVRRGDQADFELQVRWSTPLRGD